MPIIHVYLRKGTIPEYRQAIADSIHQAIIDVFGVPEDDYFQLTHEKELENMHFDRNYFGIKRSDDPVFIQLAFNLRPPGPKQALFAAIVENLTRNPGIPREDIYMNIVECAPENWWIHGRTINPETGTDSRMGSGPRHVNHHNVS